jgi:hypothetical protein
MFFTYQIQRLTGKEFETGTAEKERAKKGTYWP